VLRSVQVEVPRRPRRRPEPRTVRRTCWPRARG